MISFKSRSKYYNDAEEMASAYLSAYYGNSEIEYPITWMLLHSM